MMTGLQRLNGTFLRVLSMDCVETQRGFILSVLAHTPTKKEAAPKGGQV